MNSDLVFRLVLAILFVLVIVTRRYYERMAAKTDRKDLLQDEDAGAMVVLQSFLLTLSNLAMIVYLINSDWIAWSSLMLPDWARWLGVVVGASGTALLIWTHRILGENFFGGMKIRAGHELITKGPYQWVRHPMYTAFILLGVAWFLLSGNWLISGLWLIAALLVLVTRLDAEEKMMLDQFGDSYRVYQQRTGRLLPKLRSD